MPLSDAAKEAGHQAFYKTLNPLEAAVRAAEKRARTRHADAVATEKTRHEAVMSKLRQKMADAEAKAHLSRRDAERAAEYRSQLKEIP